MRLITGAGIERCSPDRIEALLDGPGMVWIDVMYWDADTAAFLSQRLQLERQVTDGHMGDSEKFLEARR